MNVNDGAVPFVVPVGPPVIVVSGAAVSTVNDRDAGVASTLPAASVARTRNVYAPSASEPRMRGDVHGPNVPTAAPGPSRRHSNVEPASELVNVNVAVLTLIGPVGPPVIVVSGAAVSTVNARVAGVASALPRRRSRAPRTCRRRRPASRTARGEVQAAYVPVVAPGPSSLHSNVEPASVEVNANDGEAPFVAPVGPAVIAVSGADVSTVKARVAGVASTLPAASVARTENVYAPSASGPTTRGEVHAHVGARSSRPARRACTRRSSPPRCSRTRTTARSALVVPVGPRLIVVSGAAVSTVNARVAGVASTLPAASVARTENV